MVSLYSPPNEDLLRKSFNTLYSCSYTGQENLRVVNVKTIKSVVAVIPHSIVAVEDEIAAAEVAGKVFIVEKLGLDVMTLAGVVDGADGDDDDEEDPEGNEN